MALNIGFMGAGNMASALARGWIANGLVEAKNVWLHDIDEDKAAALAKELGATASDSIAETLRHCETIVLAVKPQDSRKLLPTIIPHAGPKHLFVSIMAGVKTPKLEDGIGMTPRVVRVMPNTPSLVGVGAAAAAKGKYATDDDLALVLKLFRAVGIAEAVEEDLLHAVTAISGSGPAYFFRMMEAMTECAIEAGLPPEIAGNLVIQTALGAGRLAVESADSPQTLREKVTSKGGTTEAGLKALEEGGFPDLVRRCVFEALKKSRELAGEKP